MTETWAIALILLGCPVILGSLLLLLSVVEDSLTESASPAVRDASAESEPATSQASPAPAPRAAEAAPVAEGAHL